MNSAAREPITVVIAGLGKIGHGYDRDQPPSVVHSHSRAFLQNSHFRLLGGVDPNPDARARFETDTGISAYSCLSECPDAANLVVIAVPTGLHLKTVREALLLNPKHLLLEKPVAASLEDALEIESLIGKSGVTCSVNYFRRMDPGFLNLKKALDAGTFGEFRGGICAYSRGLLNTASHYIDLFNFLLGPGSVSDLSSMSGGHPAGEDPDMNFTLSYANAPLVFAAAKQPSPPLGEAELRFSRARVTLSRYCEEIQVELHDSESPNHDTHFSTDTKRYQAHVVSHLYETLIGKTDLLSSLGTAMVAMKICGELRK